VLGFGKKPEEQVHSDPAKFALKAQDEQVLESLQERQMLLGQGWHESGIPKNLLMQTQPPLPLSSALDLQLRHSLLLGPEQVKQTKLHTRQFSAFP